MSNSAYTDADRADYEADIDAIANDPTLTPEQKTEALTDRYEEELDTIEDSFHADTADTDTATGAADSATGAADSATGTADSSTDTVDSVSGATDSVGTDSTVDQNGDVTLTDGDDAATTAAPGDDTIRVTDDLDGDGAVDLATYLDPTTGNPVRQDGIEDGRVTDTLLDTTGSGSPDTHLVDTDGDGRFDTVDLDTDGDGLVNETLVDTDGDGSFDVYTADLDNTGDLETHVTADEVAGGLGDIDAYETLIPAGDPYHDQVDFHADAEPEQVVLDELF